MAATLLFTDRTSNGNSDSFDLPDSGREVVFSVDGTFDGATVTAAVSHDGGTTWHAEYAFTEAESIFIGGPGLKVRAEVASAGGSTQVTVRVQ